MTDMVIPPAVREVALAAYNDHALARYTPDGEWVCKCGVRFPDGGKPGFGREQMRPHVLDAVLAAALPHLRPLFEMATKVGLELGRKEALEELARAIRVHKDADVSTREYRLGLGVAAKMAERAAWDIGTKETP